MPHLLPVPPSPVCSVFIIDDVGWEGPETFTVRLTSRDSGVIFNISEATVIINDPEDGMYCMYVQDQAMGFFP